VESHAEFLRLVTLDPEFARALKRDWRSVALEPADRLMLEFVEKLTVDATRAEPSDLDRLRAGGFSDAAILQITLIAAWFNYINRVADALGVGRDSPAD
jgi:uncharacterized peroxidase-related enzyme